MHKTNNAIALRDFRKLLLLLCAFSLPLSIILNSWLIALLLITSITDFVIQRNLNKEFLEITFSSFFFICCGYFIWTSLGLMYSKNITQALKDIEQSSALLVFPIIALINRDIINKTFIKHFLIAFLSALLLLILFAEIHQIILIIKKNEPFYYLFRWRHSSNQLLRFIDLNPNYFSMYCVFLSLAVILLEFRNWIKIILFLTLAFFTLHLVNRTGILLLGFIMLLTLAVIFYRNRSDKKTLILPTIILGVLLIFMMVKPTWIKKKLVERNFKEENGSTELVLDNRIPRWRAVWAVIQANPIIGVGPGDTTEEFLKEYEKRGLKNDLDKKYHAHNQYLQTWAASGIIGLILLLIPLFIGIYYSLKKRNYLMISFLLTFMVFSLTESTFKRQKGVVYYALFQSVLLIQLLKKDEEPL